MPAQTLLLLLKGTNIFIRYITGSEYQDVMLQLLLKSLECGVPKLQLTSLEIVHVIGKKIEYAAFKSQILPRILHILEKSPHAQLKIRCLDTIK
jgi:hypothetical protein